MSAPSRTAGTRCSRSRIAAAATAALLVTLTGCADDNTARSGGTEPTASDAVDVGLLGAEELAAGEPVKIGQLTEGMSASIDASDELVGGQVAVDYVNAYEGGIAGRPIELVTCEMKADPSTAQDCANKMIAEDVVAVASPQIVYAEEVWTTLHDAGIPLVLIGASSEKLETDSESTFIMGNPQAGLWGLPVALANSVDAAKVAYVIVDVPQARDLFENDDGATMAAAGLDFEVVPIPLGTPDMVPQMEQVKAGGAGVVHILGNDSFCIAAIQGLHAVGYTGAISTISQCFTDATRSALAGQLEGVNVSTPTAEGATDDPSYDLYRAVMEEFGDDVEDTGGYTLSGYVAVASLAATLQSLEGEVTAASASAAIRAMPETELPVGGGVMIKCGGSAVSDRPAICTNQWLRGELDADGNPVSYTVEDSSDLFG